MAIGKRGEISQVSVITNQAGIRAELISALGGAKLKQTCAGDVIVLNFEFELVDPPVDNAFSMVTFQAPNSFKIVSQKLTPKTYIDMPGVPLKGKRR